MPEYSAILYFPAGNGLRNCLVGKRDSYINGAITIFVDCGIGANGELKVSREERMGARPFLPIWSSEWHLFNQKAIVFLRENFSSNVS